MHPDVKCAASPAGKGRGCAAQGSLLISPCLLEIGNTPSSLLPRFGKPSLHLSSAAALPNFSFCVLFPGAVQTLLKSCLAGAAVECRQCLGWTNTMLQSSVIFRTSDKQSWNLADAGKIKLPSADGPQLRAAALSHTEAPLAAARAPSTATSAREQQKEGRGR